MRDGDAFGIGDAPERLHQGEVPLDISFLESGAHRTEVAALRITPLPMAADQASRKHAIGSDGDAELAAHRHDFILNAA